jgi:hypothetical protein
MTTDESSVEQNVRFLNEQGYYRTAKEILTSAKVVGANQISKPNQVFERMFEIFNIFAEEFAAIAPIGEDYRRRCYGQTQIIVLEAFLALKDKKIDLPAEYCSYLKKMNTSDDNINALSEALANLYTKRKRSFEESQMMFNYACYIYQVAIEGIFSQLAKTLYGFLSIRDGKIPEPEELNIALVWKIYHKCEKDFGMVPVFLENWYEKSSIRNAIAHAQANYDPSLDAAHFVAQDSKTGQIYDKTMSFEEFFVIWMEVADAIDSFRYSMRMQDILDEIVLTYLKMQEKNSTSNG